MKIAIVGGGSYSWVPMLVQNFLANEFLKSITICLMDIHEAALQDLYDLCHVYKKYYKRSDLRFQKTTDLKKALADASYVIVAISHGGLEAELEDHRMARRFGYYNMKGSEVGIAGASRTLRHVPELVRIARLMEKVCPGAMLLNVTNPLTALTRSVNKYTSIKAVGFCHGVINHLHILFPYFGAKNWDEVDFEVAGVDHLSWLLNVKVRGRDALQLMKDKGLIEAAKRGDSIGEYDDPFAGRENQRCRFLLWDKLGYLPAISDEHCIEFFGQFMGSAELREHYKVTYDRIAERTATVNNARSHIKGILQDNSKIKVGRSGEIIDRFISALHGGPSFTDVMNIPNQGQIPNLPRDSVVEGKVFIDSNGVHPVQSRELPPLLEAIVRPVIIREELYMEAAMENDVNKLRGALGTDPLVNDFRRIDDIAAELMSYNRQFAGKPSGRF